MSPRHESARAAPGPGPGVAALHPALPWLLALLAGLVALRVVPSTLTLLVQGHSTLPYWDQWNEITVAEQLGALLGQHNEHRLFFPRLIYILDTALAAGTNVLNIAAGCLIQLAHAGLLAWIAGRAGGKVAGFTLFAGLLGLATALSAYQWENLAWGFQSQFLGVFCLATAAFAGLAVLPGSRGLLAGIGFAGVATFTMAQGVLVPALLLPLAVVTGRRRRDLALLAAAATALLWLFFLGYHTPLPPKGQGEGSVAGVIGYFLAYLGAPFGFAADHLLPGRELRDGTAIAGGVVGVAVAAVLGLRLALRRLSLAPAQWALAFLPLMVLGTAALTALGRAKLGLDQAYSWRYGTPVLLFWCALGLLLWTLSPQLGRLGRRALLVGTVGFLATLAVVQKPARWVGGEIASRREEATLGLLAGVPDLPIYSSVVDDTAFLTRRVAVLRAYRLGPFAAPWADWLGRPLAKQVALLPPGRCLGALDRVESPGGSGPGLRALGWAWDHALGQPVGRLVLVDAGGLVVGYGATGVGRPDVVEAIPAVTDARVGWRAVARAPAPGTELRAYGLVDNSRNACPIPGAVATP